MKSSVSIALFFLLSGFFLAVLLGAVEHSRKLLGAAAVCLAAVVCIIVFLTPVQLPIGKSKHSNSTSTSTAGRETLLTTSSTLSGSSSTARASTTLGASNTTEATGARLH